MKEDKETKDWNTLKHVINININQKTFDFIPKILDSAMEEGILLWSRTAKHWILDFKDWTLGGSLLVLE